MSALPAAVAPVTDGVVRPTATPDGYALISVVTPSYNQGAYIGRCIESVLAQGYPDFEHIVYDNCSTDGTLDVLRRYPHVIWVSEPDRGQTDALNKALRKARGEIIAWINADDFYAPGAFAIAGRELRADTGVQAVAGCVQVFDGAGRLLETTRPRVVAFERLVEFWSGVAAPDQQGLFFRKEVLERIGYFDDRLQYVMDYEFWLRLARHFRVKTVGDVLSCYVIHPRSKTGLSRFRSGFRQEAERVSRSYWGPWRSLRRWRRAHGCNAYVADLLVHTILDSHQRGPGFCWADVAELLRRRPLWLLRRHVAAALVERLIGARTWGVIKRVLHVGASSGTGGRP